MPGKHLAEHERIIGRMVFGHEEPQDLLLTESTYAQRGHDRTVDATGNPNNGTSPVKLSQNLFAQRCGNSLHFRRGVQLEHVFVKHG
jgi:hypothetical protein